MKEPYQSATRCAYEVCQKADPIEIIPRHRRRQYHDEACRQAQHRLLEGRRIYETLCQAWAPLLLETRAFLEDLLAQHGEAWTHRAIAAITAERNQARQPSLSEDEQASLRQQWADLQPFTRTILEGLLTRQHEGLGLLNLITLAIGEERTHATVNSEREQRLAYLEVVLAEYRLIIDLEDREKIGQQFMAMGELLGYRALAHYRLCQGTERWLDYRSWTDERMLAEVILAEEAAAREHAQEKSRLRQAERQLATAEQERQALQERVQELEISAVQQQAEWAEWTAWKEAKIVFHTQLSAMQQYLQEHPNAAIPLVRNGVTMKIVALGNDGLAVSEDHGLIRLSDDELEQGRVFVARKTGVPVIATRQSIGAKRYRDGRND